MGKFKALWGCGLMVVALAVPVPGLLAQAYPAKPIRIVTTPPGGANDFAVRLMAPELGSSLGQSIVIDNRSAVLAGAVVAKAAPDGYTFLLIGSSLWLLPLFSTAPYDVDRDFVPVTTTNNAANVLVVHPSLPPRSVRELVAFAKMRPGQLNFGTGAEHSSSPYLAGILFNTLAGTKIVPVPYKGVGPALVGLLSGEVHMAFPTGGSVKSHVESGRLRALGIGSAKPSRLYPGLPTIAESLPGYESTSVWGVLAPAGTPAAIVERLSQEIGRVLKQPDIIERFLRAGMETEASSPQQFAAVIKGDIDRWTKIKNTGAWVPGKQDAP
jgi:tripartite-type tricarboxylate transporter receptor subunit TctC